MKSWIRIHDIRTLDNYSLQEKMLQEELEAFYGRDIILADRYRYLKETVAREKLLNWGLGKMDWTLTIDRTWFLHFTD